MTTDQQSSPPVIAIIGRPNVGKSSLFNRILGRRIAIVHEQSGVTRDRIAAPVVHEKCHFFLVDTGGLGIFMDDRRAETFDELIRSQIEAVIREAARIIWMVDARDGVTPLDQEIATLLREAERPALLVANKADNERLKQSACSDFLSLGFGEPLPISCVHGRGVDDVLEWCTDGLASPATAEVHDPGLKLAIVGRPNVGKSSLVNRLLGEDRVIVSDIPGTTRDAVDIPIEIDTGEESMPVTIIDTAGLRRRRQVDNVVELFSVMRAENAVKRSDITILVLDAAQPATAQDRRIAHLIAEHKKPCMIVANKWDLAGKDRKMRDLMTYLRRKMAFMDYAPIVGICAISGYNLNDVIAHLLTIQEEMAVTIPTGILNRFIQETVANKPPPAVKGKHLKIFYATMTGNPPPTFALFVNRKELCPSQYQRFLANSIREAFFPEFGLPIDIRLRARRSPQAAAHGTRQAISGVKRKEAEKRKANKRRTDRRKGYRKKK
ncbi:MAG: ribosome biogenesis GTPase Der [Candidatus Pacebacteria bacterium]|nr:ribosome biogenesis GTPase Der [Candidatus Paceibacterota bacterium]